MAKVSIAPIRFGISMVLPCLKMRVRRTTLKDVPKDQTVKKGQVIDPLVHFVGRTQVEFIKGDQVSSQLRPINGLIDRTKNVVSSSHRQLSLDFGRVP